MLASRAWTSSRSAASRSDVVAIAPASQPPAGASAPSPTDTVTTWRRTVGVDPGQLRRVAVASSIGTTIEWYDFFIFSTAVPLVFNTQFFSTLSPASGTLAGLRDARASASWPGRSAACCGGTSATWSGRKAMLVASLLLMGAATVGVGTAAHLRPDRRARADPAGGDAAPAGRLGGWRVGRRRADGRRARPAGQARGLRRVLADRGAGRADPRAAGVHRRHRVDHPGAVRGLGLAAAVPVQHRAGRGRARRAAVARGEPGVHGAARASRRAAADRSSTCSGSGRASWCSPR